MDGYPSMERQLFFIGPYRPAASQKPVKSEVLLNTKRMKIGPSARRAVMTDLKMKK